MKKGGVVFVLAFKLRSVVCFFSSFALDLCLLPPRIGIYFARSIPGIRQRTTRYTSCASIGTITTAAVSIRKRFFTISVARPRRRIQPAVPSYRRNQMKEEMDRTCLIQALYCHMPAVPLPSRVPTRRRSHALHPALHHSTSTPPQHHLHPHRHHHHHHRNYPA